MPRQIDRPMDRWTLIEAQVPLLRPEAKHQSWSCPRSSAPEAPKVPSCRRGHRAAEPAEPAGSSSRSEFVRKELRVDHSESVCVQVSVGSGRTTDRFVVGLVHLRRCRFHRFQVCPPERPPAHCLAGLGHLDSRRLANEWIQRTVFSRQPVRGEPVLVRSSAQENRFHTSGGFQTGSFLFGMWCLLWWFFGGKIVLQCSSYTVVLLFLDPDEMKLRVSQDVKPPEVPKPEPKASEPGVAHGNGGRT